MPIPMQVPSQFVGRVLTGEVVRHGCILKEVANGRIVGHLKEVGRASILLAEAPVNPLATGVKIVAQIGRWIDTHVQLKQIQLTLQRLQLISTAGVIVSVAGLGASLAGFALVLQRLSRLEQNLNQAMQGLRADIERLHLRFDLLEMGELRTAQQQLDGARHCDQNGRATELLKDADRTFQKHRNYYYTLITELRPAYQPKLSLAQVRELYGRLFVCSLAELEANLRLGDLPQWHFRHAEITKQLEVACGVDDKEILRRRHDGLGLATQQERENLKEQAVFTRDFCRENRDRIATAEEEVKWLERSGLSWEQYSRELEAAPDEGVLLILHAVEADS